MLESARAYSEITLKALVPIRSPNLSNEPAQMGNYLGKANTVSNLRPLCQTRQSLVNSML